MKINVKLHVGTVLEFSLIGNFKQAGTLLVFKISLNACHVFWVLNSLSRTGRGTHGRRARARIHSVLRERDRKIGIDGEVRVEHTHGILIELRNVNRENVALNNRCRAYFIFVVQTLVINNCNYTLGAKRVEISNVQRMQG